MVNFMSQLLYTGGTGPSTKRVRGLVGPKFSLNAVINRKTFTPPEIEPDSWVVEHVASHYSLLPELHRQFHC
jgi:hypothetical protein